nr:MAG TPA: YvbH-like protein [Microviridae sp.]
MVNLELSYAHYSVLLQSLLCRLDYLTDKIDFYSQHHNIEMVSILKDDFSDVYELYIKLKNT